MACLFYCTFQPTGKSARKMRCNEYYYKYEFVCCVTLGWKNPVLFKSIRALYSSFFFPVALYEYIFPVLSCSALIQRSSSPNIKSLGDFFSLAIFRRHTHTQLIQSVAVGGKSSFQSKIVMKCLLLYVYDTFSLMSLNSTPMPWRTHTHTCIRTVERTDRTECIEECSPSIGNLHALSSTQRLTSMTTNHSMWTPRESLSYPFSMGSRTFISTTMYMYT